MSEQSIESHQSSGPLEKIIIPLENEWSIFFDVRQKRGCDFNRYENCCTKIGTFNSVQTFWQYWNNFMDVTFPDDSNIRLFKNNIKPMWEDPANIRGGQISLWSPKKDTPRLWLDLVLSVIGEQFEHGYSLCGVVLSTRPQKDRITVWVHSNHSKTLVEQMTEQLKVLLNLNNKVEVKYEPHQNNIKPGSFKHSKSTSAIFISSSEVSPSPLSTPSIPSTPTSISHTPVEIIEDDNVTPIILASIEKIMHSNSNNIILPKLIEQDPQISPINNDILINTQEITPNEEPQASPIVETQTPLIVETQPLISEISTASLIVETPILEPLVSVQQYTEENNDNSTIEKELPQRALMNSISPIKIFVYPSKNTSSPHLLQWLAFIMFLSCYSYSYYHLQPIGTTANEQSQVPFVTASNDANISPFVSSTTNSHLKSSFAPPITSRVASSFAAHMSTVVSQQIANPA